MLEMMLWLISIVPILWGILTKLKYWLDFSESVFAMVSPAVLVAAMRVDSSYVPYLVPTYQLAMSLHQIRCELVNQYNPTSKGKFPSGRRVTN